MKNQSENVGSMPAYECVLVIGIDACVKEMKIRENVFFVGLDHFLLPPSNIKDFKVYF